MPVASIRAGHKYLRREGGPGDYRYFYYEPGNGRGRATTTAEEHALAKVDHVRRMLAHAFSRQEPVNSERIAHIASKVGVEPTAVRWELSNMRARGRRAVARNPDLMPGGVSSHDVGHHGHGYEAHHLAEAVATSTVTSGYDELVEQKQTAESRLHGPTEQEAARAYYREARARDDGMAVGRGMVARAADRARASVEAPRPQIGTRMLLRLGTGEQQLWRIIQARGDTAGNRFFTLQSASDPSLSGEIEAVQLQRRLEQQPTETGSYQIIFQGGGTDERNAAATSRLEQEELQRIARDNLARNTPATPPVAPKSPSKEQQVRVGTRLTMNLGTDRATLYEVTTLTPGDTSSEDHFTLARISGPDSSSRVAGITRGSLDMGLRFAEGAGSFRVAYHAEPSHPGGSHEAPSTQQTAEARARVAAAHRPGTTEPLSSRATVVSSAPVPMGAKRTVGEVERRLRNLGFNLGALNLPEAEMSRTLGPETPKERKYRAQTVLARHGFDLGALHLPVGDDAA